MESILKAQRKEKNRIGPNWIYSSGDNEKAHGQWRRSGCSKASALFSRHGPLCLTTERKLNKNCCKIKETEGNYQYIYSKNSK